MLKQRIVTALILVILLAAALYLVPAQWVWLVFAVIVSVAGWEWAGLSGMSAPLRIGYAVAVFVLCCVVELAAPAWRLVALAVSVAFWLCVVPVWLKFQWLLIGHYSGKALGMVLLVATALALSALFSRGPLVLLATMALVWVADIAAYFAGRRFGKHKLAPTISPGKTWEGVAGACVGVVLYGLAVLHSPWQPLGHIPVLAAIAFLLVLTAVSVIGDLFESMLKRHAGVKDSSNLLPGHGGVLDRIDSLTSTLPVVALLVSVS